MKKKEITIPPQVEALLKETEENSESWVIDAEPLRQKLQALTAEQKEFFFRYLFKKEITQLPLLMAALGGKDEKLDLTIINSLGQWVSPQAATLLQKMAEGSPAKAVLKAIRKSIFRLKSMGLPVAEIVDRSPAVFHPPRQAPAAGFLSPLDSSGSRFVLLARPQIPQGVLVFNALIADLEGILDFNGFETSRKNFQEYFMAFQKEYPFRFIEADPEYCLGLIMESYATGQQKGKTPPAEFLNWRPLMGSPPPLPLKPLIYQYLKREEVESRADLLDRSASLFAIPFFQSWLLPEDEAQKYFKLFKDASESVLVLNQYQKASRVEEIYRQAVQELFDSARRLFYRRRLEEMAYYLFKEEKENEARISLAAAFGLEKESGLLSPHPFLLELVKRSLEVMREEEEEKKKKEGSDLIIRP